MNDLDLCLEVVRPCQPLRHIRHWISRKPETVRDRGLVSKDHR